MKCCGFAAICVVFSASAALAENASRPAGEPLLERPTFHCLGVHWIISGDDNGNASVAVEYRKSAEQPWRKGYPLFRVEKGAHIAGGYGSRLDVPKDGWLFAGSIVLLDPDTEYQLRLTLSDPDGGASTQLLTARTRAEPRAAPDAPIRHVVPGTGGGRGTVDDPYRGLESAQKAAAPGDIMLLHAGAYSGEWMISKSGEPLKPIIWRGADDGAAIIDGQGDAPQRPKRAIAAPGAHDVWFENLTIRNADWGFVAHESARLVVRRCRIHRVDYGFTATRNPKGNCNDILISDNIIEGPCTWPRSKGIEDPRGIQISGEGHIVCYNRIRNFADAIDTMPSPICAAIDFHNNDILEMTDDGIEMDFSQRNTRCFNNRLTSVFQGISVQPVFGGPVYIFRNTICNIGVETFKMHNSPSGVLVFHNTAVKNGPPLVLWTNAPVRNCIYRNNLFIGTAGDFAYDCDPRMIDCDFDYDGFGGGPFKFFLKWNRQRYATIEDVRAKAPVYRHVVVVDPASVFASRIRPPQDPAQHLQPNQDLRLAHGGAAVDAGQVLPGFNDGFTGRGPDLGAFELGSAMPHYGPRP